VQGNKKNCYKGRNPTKEYVVQSTTNNTRKKAAGQKGKATSTHMSQASWQEQALPTGPVGKPKFLDAPKGSGRKDITNSFMFNSKGIQIFPTHSCSILINSCSIPKAWEQGRGSVMAQ
jgi:hypothetical protein